MTTMQDTRVRVIGEPRLLAGIDQGRLDWQRHHWTHGTQPDLTRETYTRLAEAVGLRGRGGAAFPVALKLADLPARGVEAVVVNGSESEPVSRKDRLLLTVAPHLVLDGAVGLAGALGAPHVLIAVHDAAAATSVREAIVERDDGVAIEVSDTPGRFVAGEARAVLSALEGGPAVPPGRRVLPTRKGYHRRPTFLSNVETFAQLAVLARLGSKGFSSTGLISEPGTQLLTLDGAVRQPGVIETPTGVPLDTVLQFAGAESGPVLLGGYHGRWLARTDGLMLQRPEASAGIILALGSDTCPLGEVHRVAGWLASQSAGQCGPCVFGLAALVDDFGRLVSGEPAGWHDAHRHLGLRPGAGRVRAPGWLGAVPRVGAGGVRRGRAASPRRRWLWPAGQRGPPCAWRRVVNRLEIDWTRCDGHGLCATLLPDDVVLDEWGFPVLRGREITAGDAPAARRAILACPALALRFADR